MEMRIPYGLTPSLPSGFPRTQDKADSARTPFSVPSAVPADTVVLSPAPANNDLRFAARTRLVNEQREEMENGYRLIRTFEQADGRSFTRAEEIVLTAQGARRAVAQQNPSGNIIRYEEILDREETGYFRRTQRYQDEGGDIATNITTNYHISDPFILTGTGAPSYPYGATPFMQTRGTQLDLHA